MVKIPSMPENFDPAHVERRTQFMHDLAALLSVWAELEMAIEFRIAKLVGMNPLDASIVLGSLQAGGKQNILYSLLAERGLTDERAAIKAAVSFAKRNVLVHSQFGSEDDFSLFRLFKREVKDSYKVIRHDYTAETFNDHFMTFRELVADALAAMKVTPDDIVEYGRAARFEGLK